MRLVRLFGSIFSLALRREFAFRANLVFQVLMTIIGIASGLVTLSIIYTQTRSLGGWSLAQVIVLFGTFQVMGALLGTFIQPNVTWFSDQVKAGKLDSILLQPVPSIFLASLGTCAPFGLFQVAMGVLVSGIGLYEGGIIPSFWQILAWVLFLLIGIVIMWASRVLIAIVAFWSPALELDVLYVSLWEFGRYPVSIYHQPLRALLTYVLPVGFIATFPAQALTRGSDPLLLAGGLVLSSIAFSLVLFVWNAGLRRYTSATS